MKRTREITIIRYRRRWVKKRRAVAGAGCPVCGSDELITVPAAVRLTGLSRATLDEWITSRQVHATGPIEDRLRLRCRSLLARVAQGALSSGGGQ